MQQRRMRTYAEKRHCTETLIKRLANNKITTSTAHRGARQRDKRG